MEIADMSLSNDDVHDWAQKALDKYNGGYTASDINLNATTHLYGLRDDGNADPALAVASHYLHCRYVASRAYVVGAIIGTVLVWTYDVEIKLVDGLIKKYSSRELVHKIGKAPTSSFSWLMVAWDMQALSDGVGDFSDSTPSPAGHTPICFPASRRGCEQAALRWGGPGASPPNRLSDEAQVHHGHHPVSESLGSHVR